MKDVRDLDGSADVVWLRNAIDGDPLSPIVVVSNVTHIHAGTVPARAGVNGFPILDGRARHANASRDSSTGVNRN